MSQASTRNQDLIKVLPGLPYSPPFQQHSGYLQGLASNQLHYWFVESQHNPKTDPLLLWLNGGPGCSSIDGLLTENGPFAVNDDGKTLYYRNTTWNKFANVLYLESPAGVGFSYNHVGKYHWNDDVVAQNNHAALHSFFKKFPSFTKNPFFITGESYAGVYIPTLVARLLNDSSIALQGFAIGNAVLSAKFNTDSSVYFAYYHGIIGDDLWAQLQLYCCTIDGCQFYQTKSQQCKKYSMQVRQMVSNHLNDYYIYGDCQGVSAKQFRIQHILDDWDQVTGTGHPKGHPTAHPTPPVLPCIDSKAETIYLNRHDVRQALHIPHYVPPWRVCSAAINKDYNRNVRSPIDLFPKLLKKFRALIYNGDVDIVCNFLGDEMAVSSLDRRVIEERRPWFYNDTLGPQVGGYVVRYDKIDFLTIRGAGHMAPAIKPWQTYQAIYNFVFNRTYSDLPNIV
ncbi:uncharacterized protein TRIADDRAFT_61540 [Trichoplax adhaerens]|uniref:Carboxypeptidase n=1 Tax=Trichoplax adhaerens TaxID=10228 RepID=B3SB99_TRIAD|nr:hypothetical protein TRIADDRAFT_61540 [Trichoplax adhaerens]EDV19923.1 hypothetical protein TRIADDRAFT_61540 [Trichoplax adhaerens]|eukprot:XP_002117513.1 hypothetical protein TRIADDRAFT_61540 [Trichoplax adhaerens]